LSPGVPVPLEPPPHEDWFEWHSLLSAISDARDQFVMAELGAGHGRWAVGAGVLARRFGLPFSLICVEAEPTHFAMLLEHMRDNEIEPSEHRLIQAAVTDKDGDVFFAVGHPQEWWGQCILGPGDLNSDLYDVARVASVCLGTVLDGFDRVDLIDMDIQGAEADVIESSLSLIRRSARYLHIGTHSQEVEERIRAAMRSIDFRLVWDFPCAQTVETPIGRVEFQDGVQAWVRQ
jgi:FkbM family methyltransferase